jgi:very-short-patch-repair endonuclease
MDSPQAGLIALLEYIEHVEKLNRTPAFDVPLEFYAGYEADLRGLPGLEFDSGGADDDTWLRIDRLKEREPPEAPEALRPWLILSKSPEKDPALRDEIVVPGQRPDSTRQIARSSNPGLDAMFRAYVHGPWAAWADAERPRRRTIAVYNKLFLLQQTLEAEGAEMPLELVWGIGVAVWKHPHGQLVRYPIITQLVEIALDTQTMALEVRPRERLPRIETDGFVELGVHGVVHLESAWRAHLERIDATLSPFDQGSFEGILKASVGFLDAGGAYWPEVTQSRENRVLPTAIETLRVTDTWVLFARKRSPNFLIEDLERLRRNLEDLTDIPPGPAAIVTKLASEVSARPRLNFRGLSYSGREPTAGTPARELYFPKPYNDEQVSIIEKLESTAGVVVQGPPGTGKTHTIANVICHYLANGKRVLVTSKGEPALAVLRAQIPESVRALSVALLTDEKDGMRQFEHAIQTIAATVARIQPDEIELEISTLSRRVDELHSTLSAIDSDISKWARLHLRKVKFGEREVLPEELARIVVEQEEQHQWMPDELSDQMVDPGITDADIQCVRKARVALRNDLSYLGADLPVADSFGEPSTVAQLHEALRRASEIGRKLQQAGGPRLVGSQPEVMTEAETLLGALAAGLEAHDRVYRYNLSWTAPLHRAYGDGNSSRLDVLQQIVEDGSAIEVVRQEFVRKPVDVTEDAELDTEFADAVARLARGKSALGLLSFGKAAVKLQLEAVRVCGLKPDGAESWNHVSACLEHRRSVRAFLARWNAAAGELQLPRVEDPKPSDFKRVGAYIAHIESIRELATSHRQRIHEGTGRVFERPVIRKDITLDREEMQQLHEALIDHLTRLRLENASGTVQDYLQKLIGKRGAVVDAMRTFLKDDLGSERIDAKLATVRWSEHLAELRRLAGLKQALRDVEQVAELVESAGARKWADAIRTNPVTGDFDPWTPGTWLEAWRWRQAATFIDAIDGRSALRKLQARRQTAELDLAIAYRDLVEKKTWLEVYRNSPPAVKSALQAYLNAIRHIGKGTGIRAVRFRKEARAAMLEAYQAVPCWILPQWRVSETLPAEIGKFDLVIIDEASQSDLWALPCLLRGAKLLVVGDDKQVSPDGIGLAEERIKDLKNRFLREQAHGDQMTPEKSLYDLAKVVFAGELVMLREHFRSVAPIIEFSKREFYNHEIRPLRVPKGSERLDPPLIDVYVRGGARRGKVNEAEARAIVDEMKKLLAEPRYGGRSIGVVSLLGIEQAHRIFELVKEEIPAEEIVSRQITVGDARTFQGKERDIMFLSMVATPDQKTTSTAQMFEQRFNVAASRARDRMYLFRSVELQHLNKNDLKAKLIEHFQAPFHQDPVRVATLRELCESDFEREMFDVLTDAGYRVKPQVQVGGYRIDMVVEGDEDRRLAVECDGDKYHGPEQWGHDMARQRILERAGWSFWRCFGSSFNRDRKGTMDDLWETLRRMGIEPIGAAEVDLGRYTEHREVSPFGSVDDGEDAIDASPAEGGSDVSGEVALRTTIERPYVAPRVVEYSYSRSTATPDTSAGLRVAEPEPGRQRPSPIEAECSAGGSDSDSEARQASPRTDVGNDTTSHTEPSNHVIEEFLTLNSLTAVNHRAKGGALWILGDPTLEAAARLRKWGFRYAAGKGWWIK